MSHRNKESLIYQATESLKALLKIGESKHLAKQDGSYKGWIYSYDTFQTYLKAMIRFVKYCKAKYGCKTLEQCRAHANEWLETRLHTSAWTVAMERSALVKLYRCSSTEFIKLPPRIRDNTERSRGPVKRDAHFSEKKNRDLIDFCVSCGPRRRELKALTGDKLVDKDGNPYVTGDAYILFNKGTKGGRNRISPVMGDPEKVIALMRKAGSGKVFPKVHDGADIHHYRAVYAAQIYRQHARDLKICENERFYNKEHFNGKDKPRGGFDRDSVYRFRKGNLAGQWLDKKAMLAASRALGHNRISVFASNYAYALFD